LREIGQKIEKIM